MFLCLFCGLVSLSAGLGEVPLLMSKHVRLEVLPEDACNGHRQLSARKATHESHDFRAEVHGPGTSTASCMGTRRRDHKKNGECSFNVSSTSEDETGGQQSSGGASQHYRQSSNSQAEMEQTMLEGRTPLAAIIMT